MLTACDPFELGQFFSNVLIISLLNMTTPNKFDWNVAS